MKVHCGLSCNEGRSSRSLSCMRDRYKRRPCLLALEFIEVALCLIFTLEMFFFLFGQLFSFWRVFVPKETADKRQAKDVLCFISSAVQCRSEVLLLTLTAPSPSSETLAPPPGAGRRLSFFFPPFAPRPSKNQQHCATSADEAWNSSFQSSSICFRQAAGDSAGPVASAGGERRCRFRPPSARALQ